MMAPRVAKNTSGLVILPFPDFAERRAVFLKSDTRLMVLAHWHDGLGEDLRHELIHGYLHAEFNWLPLWLDEGLAEYFELPAAEPTVHRSRCRRVRRTRALACSG